MNLKLNRKVLAALLVTTFTLTAFSCFFGGNELGYNNGVLTGYNTGYPQGQKDGTVQALNSVSNLLAKEGVNLAWSTNADGSYQIQVLRDDGTMGFSINTSFDVYSQHFRNGVLIDASHHTMTVTNYGKDWVEQQLFNPNATCKALYLSFSNDTSAVSTAWTAIPGEYTTDGLSRATGSYVSTGVGAANVTATVNILATASTQLYGINGDPASQSTLIAAEQQGAGAAKNFISGDTLVQTVQWSHS
jgi:hypothetical protein